MHYLRRSRCSVSVTWLDTSGMFFFFRIIQSRSQSARNRNIMLVGRRISYKRREKNLKCYQAEFHLGPQNKEFDDDKLQTIGISSRQIKEQNKKHRADEQSTKEPWKRKQGGDEKKNIQKHCQIHQSFRFARCFPFRCLHGVSNGFACENIKNSSVRKMIQMPWTWCLLMLK